MSRVLTATLIAAASAGAQQPALAPRPAAPPPADFRFPVVVSCTLPNGLRLVVSENHSLPVVAVRAVIAVDSTQDPAGKYGLSSIVKRAMGAASAHYTAEQLADTLASLGVSLTPTSFTTRTDNVRPALGIMADLLLHPVFSDDGLTAAKTAVLQSRRATENSTSARARETLYDELFGDSSAYTHRPSAASLAAITASDVASFHDRWFVPTRATLVMVGDITPDQAQRAATAAFGAWKPSAGSAPVPPNSPASDTRDQHGITATPARTTIYLLDRPGAKQSTIVLGALGPERGAADFAAASAFDAQLGGTLSSRLPRVLRQQHAWAYTAASRIDARGLDEPSVMWIAADVAADKTDSALVASLDELRAATTDTSQGEADVAAARQIVLGTVQRLIATDDGLAARLQELAESRLPLDYFTNLAGTLQRVTPAQVAAAGAKFENPDRMVVVVVGDRTAIESALRATGHPVVIVPPTAR